MDKLVLKERHLISRELAERGEGSGLIVAEDERTAIMINEEDHLRLQAMAPGFQLAEAWSLADRADDEMGQFLDYAFSEEIGYLTSCPTANAGTGLGESWQWRVREAARESGEWRFSSLDGPQAKWITPAVLAEQRRMLPACTSGPECNQTPIACSASTRRNCVLGSNWPPRPSERLG